MATRCTAQTRKGIPCKAWAVPGTEPPLCAAHGGANALPGAPTGNRNAQTHGAYSRPQEGGQGLGAGGQGSKGQGLDGQIRDLDRRIERVQGYIDENMPGWSLDEINTAHRLLGDLVSRTVRARQARDRMQGSEDGELIAAVNEALDSIGAEWGVEL